MSRLPVIILRGYQHYLSPFLPPSCRFAPTCSSYAIEAFSKYGLPKGLWLSVLRLCKCHPLHPGGLDPLK